MYSQSAMARNGERGVPPLFFNKSPGGEIGAPILELESPLSILHSSFQLAISLFNIQDALSALLFLLANKILEDKNSPRSC